MTGREEGKAREGRDGLWVKGREREGGRDGCRAGKGKGKLKVVREMSKRRRKKKKKLNLREKYCSRRKWR